MQFYFHANQSHFHKNGFALRLALKLRHKRTHDFATAWTAWKNRVMTSFFVWIIKVGKRWSNFWGNQKLTPILSVLWFLYFYFQRSSSTSFYCCSWLFTINTTSSLLFHGDNHVIHQISDKLSIHQLCPESSIPWEWHGWLFWPNKLWKPVKPANEL